MPVFLILYDVSQHRAYWVYIQEYFSDPSRKPKANARSLRIRIPVANIFTEAIVDYARDLKAAILASLKGKVSHHGSVESDSLREAQAGPGNLRLRGADHRGRADRLLSP